MLQDSLKHYTLILASGSPRRQNFFKALGFDFEIRLKPVKEEYPDTLRHFEITNYLAQLKSLAFKDDLLDNDILITSDTIVWHNEKALGKPRTAEEAFEMIASLSGTTHQVITSVCFTTKSFQKTIYDTTKVSIKTLTTDEINYYIKTYNPYDKAGGYGIQEWFGYIAVTHIEGSYFNVMGLPTHLVYKTLNSIINS
ncbi:Maf-like protein [Ichthyenterobacterium sp. W332]|uniref:dTTP/UTP pyrophosphatase n=1 Tax=Microcosmobacter mediterraneus TaxID=3075607 RepID=A0ABU2YHG9_9FLAO|nr:Maf-like protein [Ichthyenterobacterium sp. W332]MDT0557616.1 Maf-like protein [Ichthyenterobacterium sp. W332]